MPKMNELWEKMIRYHATPKAPRIALNFYQNFYSMQNISISCQIALSFQILLHFVILYPILYFVVFILSYILNFANFSLSIRFDFV